MTRTVLPYAFVFAIGYAAGVFVPSWVKGPSDRATVVARAAPEEAGRNMTPGRRWRPAEVTGSTRRTRGDRLQRLAARGDGAGILDQGGQGDKGSRGSHRLPGGQPPADRPPSEPPEDVMEPVPADDIGALLSAPPNQSREASRGKETVRESGRAARSGAQPLSSGSAAGTSPRKGHSGQGGRLADAAQYAIDPSSVDEELAYSEEEDIDASDEGYAAPAPGEPASTAPVAVPGAAAGSVMGNGESSMAVSRQAGADGASTRAILARLGGDRERGKVAAKACAVCHSFKKGAKSKLGPNLYGLLGRKVGSSTGFKKYSRAMRNHGGIWTVELLDCYLKKPKKCIPGSNMAFGGLANKKLRTDVMAYILSVTAKQ